METISMVPESDRWIQPVIVVADASGSMAQDRKIDAVNASVHALLDCCTLARHPQINVGIVALSAGAADPVVAPQPTSSVLWKKLRAVGPSSLGAGLNAAVTMMEQTAGATFRPILVLVSDGSTTDAGEWAAARQRLDASATGRAAMRLAIAIGPDANLDVLEMFAGTPPNGRSRVIEPGREPEILDYMWGLPLDLKNASPLLRPRRPMPDDFR